MFIYCTIPCCRYNQQARVGGGRAPGGVPARVRAGRGVGRRAARRAQPVRGGAPARRAAPAGAPGLLQGIRSSQQQVSIYIYILYN